VEVDSISQQAQEKIEKIESADLVIGIVADTGTESTETLFDALRKLPGSPRTVVLQNDRAAAVSHVISGIREEEASFTVIPWSQLGLGAADTPVQSISSAYQSVFTISEKLGARACGVIASTLEASPAQWVYQLLRPLLEEEFDLVAAYYARRKFEGLLNSSIIYPVTRSLYGKRLHNPMGPDLGVSRQLFQRVLLTNGNSKPKAGPVHPLVSLAPTALCGNLKVGEARVGPRVYPPTDWTNTSSILVQVLGPLFLDMERNAACWQRTRGSISIPTFDESPPLPQESGKVEVGRLVDSFQLGNRDLQEIWGVVLPPATLFELAKLSRLPAEQFRMPDELWVRIVYDFALAHRLRTINHDHLLRSLTPLYLGWVASYTHEVENAGAAAVQQCLERLSVVFEAGKPYLVSRWRWPDRFNP
jgi:hypothetical protein